MRRFLVGLGVVVLVLGACVMAFVWSAFVGNKPLVAETLPGLGETVLDGYVSVALLDAGDGGWVLVDAGNTPGGQVILDALTTHGAGPEAVRAVLLTHGHPDHVAACGMFPRATVYAMAEEIPFATGTRAYLGALPKVMGPQTAPCPISPLEDGQTLTLGALEVQAFRTPGHTAGSAAYLVRDTLFLGDALRVMDGDALTGAPWMFSDGPAENVRELSVLARRLQGRPIARVLNAHTGSVTGATFLALGKE